MYRCTNGLTILMDGKSCSLTFSFLLRLQAQHFLQRNGSQRNSSHPLYQMYKEIQEIKTSNSYFAEINLTEDFEEYFSMSDC